MAHRIENGMMAYRSEVPWHGLGQSGDLAKLATMTMAKQVKYWLELAKLDWTVQRRQLAMRDADGQGLIVDPLATYRAIVRKDTNQVFQVATERYQPLQNEQIVSFFAEYCDAGHAQLETMGAIDGGSKVWCLAKLNGELSVGTNDKSQAYLLLASSHDGSMQTVGKSTIVYVVCWNTLSAALGIRGNGRLGAKEQGEFRVKHSRKWTNQVSNEAKRTMGIALEQAQETTEVANQLARVQVDDKGRREYIKRLVGGETVLEQIVTDQSSVVNGDGSYLDAILAQHERSKVEDSDDLGKLGNRLLEAILNSPGNDLPERNNTLWGAVNGVTYHVDHERGRTQDTRLNSAWFGDGDRLKRDAVKVAVEIAGVRVN